MPIIVTIHESFPKGFYRALGKVNAKAQGKEVTGEADVLIKVVGKEAFLKLNSDLHESKLMGRPVSHYNLAEGVTMADKIKIGDELEFKDVLFNLI